MAGETKGVAYEALTKLVLEDLKAEGKLKGRIFWGEKPDDMTIKPDLTIGSSANAPAINLLITHSGAAGNSHMKYWRNMGELVESKVFLPSPARVFNLAFDSVIKEDLKKVQDASFDGQLIVGDRPYGDALQAWIDSNLKGFPKDKEEKVERLRELTKIDKELRRLIKLLRIDVQSLLMKTAPGHLAALWDAERSRRKGVAPRRRETFVRNGIAKLSLLSDLDLGFSKSPTFSKEEGDLLAELGIVSRTVSGPKISDLEIQSAVSLLPKASIRVLVADLAKKCHRWLEPIRMSKDLSTYVEWVRENRTILITPTGFFQQFKACHEGKMASPLNRDYTWLFYIAQEFIKCHSQSRTGFGTAQLLSEITKARKRSDYGSTIEEIISGEPVFRGVRSIERLISVQIGDHGSKGSRTIFDRYPTDMAEVSFVLASRMAEISAKDWGAFKAGALREALIQKNVVNDLTTYRLFQPLKQLAQQKVKDGSSLKLKSCFAEAADASEIREDSGSTEVLWTKSTLINWQSCSDAGRDHKKKELCGRAVALRYSWDAKAKRFIPRPGVKKLILVVDGTWRQSDLDALVRSGWDEIYYPDEMDKLAKAIV